MLGVLHEKITYSRLRTDGTRWRLDNIITWSSFAWDNTDLIVISMICVGYIQGIQGRFEDLDDNSVAMDLHQWTVPC